MRATHNETGGGGGGGGEPKTSKTGGYEAVHNPDPIQSLQVGMGFKLRMAMYKVAKITDMDVLITDSGHTFF